MIRFWISGTSAGPISTPRSPRATITASVSASTSSRTSTASDFSIFAITCACEPACSISAAQVAHVRGRAHERERDEVDAELERELEIDDVLRRQRRDRQRDAGQIDALVRGDDAADDHLAARAARSTSPTRSRTSPSSISTSWPGFSTSPITAGATGSSPSRRASSAHDGDVLARREHDRLGERRRCGASAPAGRRSARSAGRRSASTSRTRRARSAWSSCVPCERLSRTASMPAARAARSVSGESDAGPSVATIFVRRSGITRPG